MGMRRWRAGATLVAVTLVMATGCTAVVSGSGSVVPGAVDKASGARFDALYAKAVDPLFTGPSIDSHTKTFTLATYGDQKVLVGSDVIRIGSPPSIYEKSEVNRTGQNLDYIHISGQKLDYLLLGILFKSVEPTPWVSYPTIYDGAEDHSGNCRLPGYMQICTIINAIVHTRDVEHTLLRKVEDDGAGGFKMTTGVSIATILDTGVIGYTIPMALSFTYDERRVLLPTEIDVDAQNRVTHLEINGALDANGTKRPAVAIQFGLTITFDVKAADIPALPTAIDVTALPDRAAREAMYAKITALRPQSK